MTDEQQVRQAVRDYYEAWYDGDVARMDGALHQDLVKRSPDAGEAGLGITTKQRMLELTAAGAGAEDGEDRSLEIEVHDVYRDIATVTVRAAVYYEYLQLVRTPDGWAVANALWQSRSG
jgi:ketosteroid isomerase-like protein